MVHNQGIKFFLLLYRAVIFVKFKTKLLFMKKILASLVSVSCLISIAYSQTTTCPPIRQSAIGVSFFLNDFISPSRIRSSSLNAVIRDKSMAKFKDMAPGLAANFATGITPHLDFAANLSGCFVDYPFPKRAAFGNTNFLLEGDANVQVKLVTEDYWLIPYASAGVGAHMYKVYWGAYVPIGLGLRLNLFDEAGINFTSQYRIPVIYETSNYHFYHSFGLYGVIGKKKECPPVKVVEIPQKPVEPVVAPPPADTDKDGITDDVDKCPTVPGVARYQGCPVPDKDLDGINDEEDKCPDVYGLARYGGCPVPDKDKDGVNDEEDKCPDVPGTKANSGCPEIKEEVKQKVDYAAQNILFITGSAKLTTSSYKGLDEVAKIMKDNPDVKIAIDGHTDNTGSDAINDKLSQGRADAVKNYLVSKGVGGERISSTGHGSKTPIADNKTAAGRQKNRRVEMTLGY
jgi:OmpA-OmpF porin, OOP family